jgi:hypothetical protein
LGGTEWRKKGVLEREREKKNQAIVEWQSTWHVCVCFINVLLWNVPFMCNVILFRTSA